MVGMNFCEFEKSWRLVERLVFKREKAQCRNAAVDRLMLIPGEILEELMIKRLITISPLKIMS